MKNAASSSKQAATTKQATTTKKTTRKRKPAEPTPEQVLRAALAPYVSVRRLQYLAARDVSALHTALIIDQPPPEIQAIINVLAAVLRPVPGEYIEQAADVAALLMVEMGMLTQEQLRVVYLTSTYRVQTIKTIYQGNLQSINIRTIELFHEAVRRNSGAIILVHNHPSGDPSPSAEDLFVTQDAAELGRMLGVKVVDHLVIGRGEWVSIAEKFPMVLK
ncbi:MAG: hypothetical protein JOZ51_07980 [Chloroflexi bacterium]|nr:hypothetical protein [Chloroflexota bacterium]